MSAHTSSSKDDRDLRRRLRGKALVSRASWMMRQAAYVLACVVALVAVLVFADGIWLAVGLTVVAFFVGGIFEVLIDFRYGNYRLEWELANGADVEADVDEAPNEGDDVPAR